MAGAGERGSDHRGAQRAKRGTRAGDPRVGIDTTTGRFSGGPLCFGTGGFEMLLRRINLPVRQA